jgi:heme-degrading monooxygenase HmoA
MIDRIVRMSFQPDKVAVFLTVFDASKQFIASFDGCRGLRLLRDTRSPNVYFTHSIWENEEDLEAYRKSELFERTWKQTKILFDDKPQAWSVLLADKVK